MCLFPADAAAGALQLRAVGSAFATTAADTRVAPDLCTIVDKKVDRARVAMLRQAVECGRYLVNYARIADGVIATVRCRWRH